MLVGPHEVVRDHAVRETSSPVHDRGRQAAEVDGNAGLRRGREHRQKRVVGPVRKPPLGQAHSNEWQSLFHQLRTVLDVDAEQLELTLEAASGDAQLQPPAGEKIGHDRLFDDVAPGVEQQQQRRGHEANPRCDGAKARDQRQLRGQIAVIDTMLLGRTEAPEGQ